MHQTHYHASWRISRPTTIEPEPQADIVPTGEVRAAISPRLTSLTSRKRAYSGPSHVSGYASARLATPASPASCDAVHDDITFRT
jgi:hypothetical protein